MAFHRNQDGPAGRRPELEVTTAPAVAGAPIRGRVHGLSEPADVTLLRIETCPSGRLATPICSCVVDPERRRQPVRAGGSRWQLRRSWPGRTAGSASPSARAAPCRAGGGGRCWCRSRSRAACGTCTRPACATTASSHRSPPATSTSSWPTRCSRAAARFRAASTSPTARPGPSRSSPAARSHGASTSASATTASRRYGALERLWNEDLTVECEPDRRWHPFAFTIPPGLPTAVEGHIVCWRYEIEARRPVRIGPAERAVVTPLRFDVE